MPDPELKHIINVWAWTWMKYLTSTCLFHSIWVYNRLLKSRLAQRLGILLAMGSVMYDLGRCLILRSKARMILLAAANKNLEFVVYRIHLQIEL